MTSLTFDTLKFVETLKSAEFSDAQARALSHVFREAQEARLEELATKRDLQELGKDLELKIAETETRLIKWMVGSAGLIVALIKLIP